jgi:hypothetical protein
VAAWLSETVRRGRGPGASGFESHRRGRIFSKEGTSAGPWMCVYVFQGLTVGWWKEERHSSDTTARSSGFKSRPDGPPMDVVCCIRVVWFRKEKRGGGVGGRGKYPGAPPHHLGKKERKKQAERKVPDRPVVVKGERLYLKKKKSFFITICQSNAETRVKTCRS